MEQIFTEQQEVILLGSSLKIEFLFNQNHGQIGPLCMNERGDGLKNRAAVTGLGDSPASNLLPSVASVDASSRDFLAALGPSRWPQRLPSLFGFAVCEFCCEKHDATAFEHLQFRLSNRVMMVLVC